MWEPDSALQVWGDRLTEVGKGVIYVARNNRSGKMYVGLHGAGRNPLSVRSARWKKHIDNKSCCKALTEAIQSYGIDQFSWYILEYVDESELDAREDHWINRLNTIVPNGYNLRTGGSRYIHHQETIDKMKVTRNDPEYLEGHKKRRKEQWADPANHSKWTEAFKHRKRTVDLSELRRQEWKQRTDEDKELWVEKHRDAAMQKRQRQLDACVTEDERTIVLKRFAKTDQQKEYQAKVRSGEIVPKRRK